MVPTACFARGEYFQGEGVGMVEWWNGGMVECTLKSHSMFTDPQVM